MENKIAAETIKELQIWLHGEFALVRQHQETDRDELRKVRETVHNLANQVAPLIMANIPERLAKHGSELEQLKEDQVGRKTTLTTIKAIWAGIGIMAGAVLTLAAEIAKLWR